MVEVAVPLNLQLRSARYMVDVGWPDSLEAWDWRVDDQIGPPTSGITWIVNSGSGRWRLSPLNESQPNDSYAYSQVPDLEDGFDPTQPISVSLNGPGFRQWYQRDAGPYIGLHRGLGGGFTVASMGLAEPHTVSSRAANLRLRVSFGMRAGERTFAYARIASASLDTFYEVLAPQGDIGWDAGPITSTIDGSIMRTASDFIPRRPEDVAAAEAGFPGAFYTWRLPDGAPYDPPTETGWRSRVVDIRMWLVYDLLPRGQWPLRQRQLTTGTPSWPLRQRQNAGETGSWPLRQRQRGV